MGKLWQPPPPPFQNPRGHFQMNHDRPELLMGMSLNAKESTVNPGYVNRFY